MYQTFENSSLAMTRKLDDMIDLPKSQPKRTYKEDLECEMVMVKMPRCMSILGSTDAYDEPIGSLGMMNNEVGNTIPQSNQQILPSFQEYAPLVTYPKKVDETFRNLYRGRAFGPNETRGGHSGFLGVDFSNLEMIEYDWQFESKEVSFLGEGLNLPIRPKELEKVIFDEKKPRSS
ncbi:hypothetical protein Tco_0654559 [Tanacetum coccineum]|uniref:Uncharacterized protein n=1 Tax=Tanacetum coccineum TaxID=301880 RepID=A0ABQ4X3N4_9ASTR